MRLYCRAEHIRVDLSHTNTRPERYRDLCVCVCVCVGRRLNKQLPRVGFRGHRAWQKATHIHRVPAEREKRDVVGYINGRSAPRQNNLRRPLLINSAIALLTWRG
jgi:hypothetical protein